ncbi:UNVERIFIED_CONTAM: hypothetical protein GTU68_000890 [Idotea baltica]|nr:hypothetical protein [Idotea baltica]
MQEYSTKEFVMKTFIGYGCDLRCWVVSFSLISCNKTHSINRGSYFLEDQN